MAAAQEAFEAGEVPVGALLMQEGRVLAKDRNRVEALHDPTAHAEMLCISGACSHLQTRRLPEAVLWVTVEPCPMCAYAIELARIPKVMVALPEPKTGFRSKYGLGFRFEVEWAPGPFRRAAEELMQRFFRQLRE